MTRAISVLLGLGLLVTTGVAAGLPREFKEHAAVQESLSRVHPRMRASWLKERGIDDPYYTAVRRPDSGQGLREVGRWSYGPSYDVDGRTTPTETLVALARGSGVSLLRFSRQDSLSIELLSDINAEGLMCRVKVVDTLLYVGSRKGLEVYNIADEQNPVRLSWTPIPLNDFALQDSLVYTISGDDTFRIYNVSNPASLVFRGACVDSGDLVSVAGNATFLGDRWGLYVLDVTNPASPHRIGSWGRAIEQVEARGNLCYVTTFNPNVPGEITFHVLDVAVPSLPYQIGSLDDAGGNDVYLIDTLAYGAGESDFNKMTIVSVADSTRPRLLGSAGRPGWGYGVWASGLAQAAFVCSHWTGLQTYDIGNTSLPVRDTFLLDADQAVDVYIDSGRAYVANQMSGLKILDVRDPARPTTLGAYDSAGQFPHMSSVVARDSFAFVDWFWFRAVDVGDPAHPTAAGQLDLFAPPEDVVLRDSFVYCAEMNRFQIVNVARPRQPVLVGSCVTSTYAGEVKLADTIAYISGSPLRIINISRPDTPVVIGNLYRGVSGLDVVDTILYAVGQNAQFWSLSIADPASPRPVDSLHLPGYDGQDLVVVGTTAYVGERMIRVVDVSDPSNLRLSGAVSVPGSAERLVFDHPYIYAACSEAGVCVFETTQAGVSEGAYTVRFVPEPAILYPNPASRSVRVFGAPGLERVVFRDVAGREVWRVPVFGEGHQSIDLAGLRPGLYFVELRCSTGRDVRKLIKN